MNPENEISATDDSPQTPFWLGSPPPSDPTIDCLGGKGCFLAKLSHAGLPVPPGFILPARALPGEPLASNETFRLPAPAAAALAEAYGVLGRQLEQANPLVAVRSSGLAEDLEQASFAGQYVTVLGVRGVEQVLTAAARCWQSLWLPTVTAYRERVEKRTGQVLPPPGMAVIVQALVEADAAGVAETGDTLSGNSDTITISAAWGLGRSVVDGAVEPDYWKVERASLAVLELKTGDKTVRAGLGLDAQPQPVADELRRCPCLTINQAVEIAALALKAEAIIGCPVDVEWAVKEGKVWLLQARPLTGMPVAAPAPEPPPAPGPLGPSPAFPFTWPDAETSQRHWSQKADDARVFEALQPFELDARQCNVRSAAHAAWLTGASEIWDCMEVNGYLFYTQRPAPGNEEERVLRVEARQRFIQAFYQRGETAFTAVILPEVRARIARLGAVNPDTLDAPDLATHFEETWRWYDEAWKLHMQMDDWGAGSPMERCGKLYSELTGDSDQWAVLSPFWHLPEKDHEGLVELIRLARLVKESPALLRLFSEKDPAQILQKIEAVEDGPAFLGQFNAFLAVYGLQSGASQGIMRGQIMPGWREEPALAFAIIQRYLVQDLNTLLATSQRRREEFVRLVAELKGKVAASGASAEQQAAFDFWYAALERMELGGMDHNHYIDAPMNALMHWALMASGRRLAKEGIIDQPQDVWFLRAYQVPAVLRSLDDPNRPDWHSLVAAQKTLYAWQRSLTPPAYLGAPPPAEQKPPQKEDEKEELPPNLLIKGQSAVPGRATGRVHMVRHDSLVPDLQPGDIFVVPDCGVLWASVLPVASGVILEGSNLVEHAMRVCREFGVPGIVQAHHATQRLHEGQIVTIDGEKGWILSA